MPPENQPKINKKTAITILVIILALLGIGWYVYKKQKAPAGPSQEEITKKQSEEAARQIEEFNKNPLTQEQLDKQSAEAQKQLEEFNKLKGQ